jgi:peptide/nickel transport system substrate-binding protein
MAFGDLSRVSAKPTGASYGGTLVDCTYADAQIFNPVLSSDSASSGIEGFIFESMLTYDKDMKPVPSLALDWEISVDKLDYTFYLREDVYWHDGIQFTADDVIFTWDRIMDPNSDTTRRSMFELLNTEVVPYEKLNDFTVVFHLKQTFSPMLNNMMFGIIPRHAYLNYETDCVDPGLDGEIGTPDDGKYTFNTDERNVNPIGTGPMMFEDWETDDHVTLKRNSVAFGGPGYWDEHDAYIERYIIRVITNVQSQLLALQNGEIDMMDLSSTAQEDIMELSADPKFKVFKAPTFTSDHIAFQTDPRKGNLKGSTSRDFTANPNRFAGYEWQVTKYGAEIIGNGYKVRQALNYALNKPGLIQFAYPLGFRNLGPMYLAQTEWYDQNVEPYNYDLAKANQLLDQAGYGANKDDPLRSKLDFTISYNSGNVRRDKTCTYAKDQWAALGIDVVVEALEWVSMLSTHYDGRNYDAMSAGWTGGGGDPDFSGVWSSRNIEPGSQPIDVASTGEWVYTDGGRVGGLNYMSYWNPDVDDLMDEARTLSDPSNRRILYNQIQEKMVLDSPYVWLLAHVNLVAIDSQFHGFVENSVAGLWPEPVGFQNIYFEEATTAGSSTGKPSPGFEAFVMIAGCLALVLYYRRYN